MLVTGCPRPSDCSRSVVGLIRPKRPRCRGFLPSRESSGAFSFRPSPHPPRARLAGVRARELNLAHRRAPRLLGALERSLGALERDEVGWRGDALERAGSVERAGSDVRFPGARPKSSGFPGKRGVFSEEPEVVEQVGGGAGVDVQGDVDAHVAVLLRDRRAHRLGQCKRELGEAAARERREFHLADV